jgi:integrase
MISNFFHAFRAEFASVEQPDRIFRGRRAQVHAGLRLGEVVALEWRDVDLQARRVTVQRSDWLGHVTVPKGGRSRHLPTTQRLTAALKSARHLRSDRVLCVSDGAPITRDRVIEPRF